ncbi:MAG: cytochrome P450 [Actinomycetota bacterium]
MAHPAPTTPIPRSRGLPLVGALPYLPKDPFGFCLNAALAGGGLVRLDVGPKKVLLVSHPDYLRHILVTNAANYNKGSIMDGIRVALGNGLFTSDGDLWKRQRRLLQPAFHPRRIEGMVALIGRELLTAMQRWAPAIEDGAIVDVLAELIQLNVRITLQALFGATIDAAEADGLLRTTDAVFQGMARRVWTFFVPSWLPTPGGASYREAISQLDDRIYKIIAARHARPDDCDDLLGILLATRDEETGEGMSDHQLRDEIFTFFLAGYESIATSIAWALLLLGANPDAAAALRAEVDGVLAGEIPTVANLALLTYTRMVVRETLRLYPSFPMYFRSAIGPDTVGPYSVPGGASLVLNPYATHHDPRFWSDPETFDPERFSAERFGPDERNAYFPFGKGQRTCIGESMAMTTALIVLATLLQRFDMGMPAGSGIPPGRYAMTYTPKGGLPLVLRPRA